MIKRGGDYLKIGVMQPYFFPYIGYWQLMNAVDKYVVFDDVNYINGGWINRNRILVDNMPKYINVSLLGASQNKLINEINVNPDERLRKKNLRMIELAYNKSPYFHYVMPLIEKIICCEEEGLVDYLLKSFRLISEYLSIRTEFVLSSDVRKDSSLKGQEKIIAICKELGATEYYNAIGGKELYSNRAFQNEGMKLYFLNTKEIVYKQNGNDFFGNLSIIDVMMYNSIEEIQTMLWEYNLESGE